MFHEMPDEQANTDTPRRKPSRKWYVLSAFLLIASTAVFVSVLMGKVAAVKQRIEPMPRFVGPTDAAGVVIRIDEPGKQNIFYENRGTLDGRAFDTRRRQVWTTFDTPSMTCVVTRESDGTPVQVRLPGVGESMDKREVTRDLVFAYDFGGRQAHSAWVFEADEPGDYRITLRYKDAVLLEPTALAIPPELTRAEKKQMDSAEGEAYEAARREAMEQASLAELEPVDVLFAVGEDPTRGGYFEVIGLKGAATVLAFGFTASVLIALTVFMLRGGHVTPRGEISDVQRGLRSEHEA